MLLLGAVTAFSVAVAGAVLVMEMEPAQQVETMKQVEATKPIDVTGQTSPVRVVGTPFVPNTNPRER